MAAFRNQQVCRWRTSLARSTGFIWVVLLVVPVIVGLSAEAQQGRKVPTIGIMMSNPGVQRYVDSFLQGLSELGYVEGDNILLEYRIAKGRHDHYDKLAAALVKNKVSVIVVGSTPATLAVKKATRTIPIVMAAVADPLGVGLVASLARPGGNVTGLSMRAAELSGKRLQLIKEIIPTVRHVAVLWNPKSHADEEAWNQSNYIAKRMGLRVQSIELDHTRDFDTVSDALLRDPPDAVIVLRNAYFNQYVDRIVNIVTANRLPTIYQNERFVEAGGLMSYEPSLHDLYRRAATYVDKILRGAKPAELPIEQALKIYFVINLNAAKQIGLSIPPEVLQRADNVIR